MHVASAARQADALPVIDLPGQAAAQGFPAHPPEPPFGEGQERRLFAPPLSPACLLARLFVESPQGLTKLKHVARSDAVRAP